jgi:hypothetical protein
VEAADGLWLGAGRAKGAPAGLQTHPRMKKRHGPLAPDTNDTGAIRGTVLAVTYGGRAHQLKRRS